MYELKWFILRIITRLLPKKNRVVVMGSNAAESNAIEMANQIVTETNFPVVFVLMKGYKDPLRKILSPQIRIQERESVFSFYKLILTSKYIFSTHSNGLAGASKRQISVNLTHGVPYKTIRILRAQRGALHANYTIATSPVSQKSLSLTYGVPYDKVYDTGYPRNDRLIRASKNKDKILSALPREIGGFDKMILWMPTYRRKPGNEEDAGIGMKLGTPFEVEGFDIKQYNELLRQYNTVCLLKPHYWYLNNYDLSGFSNIRMIDDAWIVEKGITLYDLLGISDLLISDYSSVIVDYMLLSRPIIAFCADLNRYKKTQGLYFDDYEKWLPTALVRTQDHFFKLLGNILQTNKDPYKSKRQQLRDKFFTFQDAKSSERILRLVFKDEKEFFNEVGHK